MKRVPLKILTVASALVLAGCQHPRTSFRPDGTSSFQFISPPPAKVTAGPAAAPDGAPSPGRISVIEPQPMGALTTPVYPPAALAARAGLVTVGMALTVDGTGRVSSVAPSLRSYSTPTPWAAEFVAAVEAAVASWRFRPAEIMHFEVVRHPNGNYMRLLSREKMEWKYDVSFTFGATGDVLAGLP